MRSYYNFILLSLTIAGVFMLSVLCFHTNRWNLFPKLSTSANINTSGGTISTNAIKKQLEFLNKTMKIVIKEMIKTQTGRKEGTKYKDTMKSMLQIDTYKSHIILDSLNHVARKHFKLLILISSNAPHSHRRNRIRQMWGNHTMWTVPHLWKVVFILGGTKDVQLLKDIHEEALRFKDIMLEDVEESFYRLSYKVMIGLQWAHNNFKFDFVLKCDDDIFVNIDRLLKKLSSDLRHKHYIGQMMDAQPVERNGRYALTKTEYERDTFDPYCSGGGYVLSSRAISLIIPFFNWESPLKIDDAYFGSLVNKAGFQVYHLDGFYMWNNECEYHEDLIISHPVKSQTCLQFLQQCSPTEKSKFTI